MSKVRVYKLVKRFLNGCENVENDECPGRLSKSTADDYVKKVKKMIMDNRRITIREIVDDVDILIGLCHAFYADVFGCETCGSKIRSKIFEFRTKTVSSRICSGVTKRSKQRSKTAKIYHN